MHFATLTALLSLFTLVAPLAVTRTARDVAPESTTTLGAPLQFTRTPSSTTTLGSPLQFTRTPSSTTTLGAPLQFTRTPRDISPNSTTTLGSPLQLTRTPNSTTTLGSPLQFTRTPSSTTTLGSPLQFTRTPSSTKTSPPTAEPTGLEVSSHFGSHYGWIGFFNSSTCEGDPIGDRPKMIDQACHPVNPTNETRQVRVFWGEWLLKFSKADVFSDATCNETARIKTIGQGEGEDCFEMEDGVLWGAVQNKV